MSSTARDRGYREGLEGKPREISWGEFIGWSLNDRYEKLHAWDEGKAERDRIETVLKTQKK